jgi:hypothetical protein
MSADWLESFQQVLAACEVSLEMMAHVLWIADEGTFVVHHILIGGNHIHATMAQNLDVHAFHQRSFVAIFVACRMGQSGRTGERREMVGAKAGNYTPVVEEIDLWVTRFECLCSVEIHLSTLYKITKWW